MRQVTITINTENSAFCSAEETDAADDVAACAELARILHSIARGFENGGPRGSRVHDINGNACGTISIHD